MNLYLFATSQARLRRFAVTPNVRFLSLHKTLLFAYSFYPTYSPLTRQ